MDKDSQSSVSEAKEKNKTLTRRQFLSRAWWAAGGLLVIEATGGFIASLWPRLKPGSFGTKVKVASIEEARAMPVGTMAYFPEQRFYLSRVESGFLALYRKCTHLGCVVPWLADDPSEDDLADSGRFNCPCHGGIFDRFGIVHSGPPPRPLDIFPISIEGGEVVVDTGTVIERTSFDESQVTEI
ncbi:MAG: ubiquinol-cytochrome c reductase iron-sulfur subunit [Dehalococcoidales bacterium]|nr:ubiquinol-cytochrome c reductase iron-sulfur subunit [Dehalococcoidales bacterium]